jgi:hypothetical protein
MTKMDTRDPRELFMQASADRSSLVFSRWHRTIPVDPSNDIKRAFIMLPPASPKRAEIEIMIQSVISNLFNVFSEITSKAI